MKYIQIAASEAEGWTVSESLWLNIAPGLPEDVTRYLTAPITDPDTGDVFFLLDDETGNSVGLDMSQAIPGYPRGAVETFDGVEWRSRHPVNTWEPADPGVPNTWSRADGTYVTPAGWEYQPGEEVTEDGGVTWFRVTQTTSFAPSASPSQYVQIDGPGGEPLQPSTEPQPWVQPTGAHDAYAAGAVVTHNGSTWENTHGDGNSWEPGVFGWSVI